MSLSGQKYDENKAKLRILQLMSYKQLRIYVDISWVINKIGRASCRERV